MIILLGDEVTAMREIGDNATFVTGRVSGIIQKDNGDLKCFYIRGIESPFWVSDGWRFQEEYELTTDEGDE